MVTGLRARFGAGACSLAALLACCEARAQTWTDTTLAPARRADLLVLAMTTSEQLELVHGLQGSAYVGHTGAIPRLGVPALNLEDGPAGVADALTQVTAFPAPITLAATWDPDLATRYGAALADEEVAKGANVLLGPMMNVDRVPAAGRNFEGFGEDPALSAALAASVVRGIQSRGIIATAKHFIDNDQETNRRTVDAIVDDRTQHEIYLPPFEACVKAGVGAVMCSYNRVNGAYACENGSTQLGWLKGELGFQGWVMSDWGATHSTAASANHGLDMEMPGSAYFGQPLSGAVSSGAVTANRLGDMAHRILTSMFAAGLFDSAPRGASTANAETSDHTALAREVAAEGTVLLKNAGHVLPLDPSNVRSIAVFGSAGSAAPIVVGSGSASVVASHVTSPLSGVTTRAGSAVNVSYDPGGAAPFASATKLAAASDVALVVVGAASGEGADRGSLSLPSPADELVAAVAAANPRTVVVVYAPAQVLMPWADAAPAILFGGMPGQEQGAALASVLFGDVNPAGRLPMTIARAAADYPAITPSQFPGLNGVVTYLEGTSVGYRHFDDSATAPLFPFGHGLSYTTFEYSNLALSPASAPSGTAIAVSFDVTNRGATAGTEVAQLYLGLPVGASEPPLQLRGFERVQLAPGASQHLTFALSERATSFWSAGFARWLAYPGDYRVAVGASSRDLRLNGSFTLSGGPLAGMAYDAEGAALSGGAAVATDRRRFTGSGFVTGLSRPGAQVTFNVTAAAAGPCNVAVRYSALRGAGTLDVLVNAVPVRATVFPGLANLDTWDFVSNTLELKAGANTIGYAYDASGASVVNLDEILVCVGQASPDASIPANESGPLNEARAGSSSPSASGCACSPASPRRPAASICAAVFGLALWIAFRRVSSRPNGKLRSR